MNATIKLENVKHYPVLLNEIISIISPLYGGTFIDCTFGQGGYSKKILENKNNKILAIDRDENSLKIANQFKKKYKNRFNFQNIKFSEILKIDNDIDNLKGIIFDLGYSTVQIKDIKKGLSFNSKGKLNMRMGLNNFSANEVINKLEQIKHDKLLHFFYGTVISFIGVGIFGLWGLTLTALVGAWKELVYDKKHGTPDIWDFVWTISPAIMFIILYNIK